MKKKWKVMITAGLALLVLASTVVPVLAQSEEEGTVSSGSVFRPGLAIVAPRAAQVGEKVGMTVFDRPNQEPVKDAGVWAFTREKAEAMQADIASIREADEAAEPDYESLANIYGTFLGYTSGSGKLQHTFDEAGWHLLVAIKQGYFPGRTGIAIGTIRRALAIEAPRMAPPGEEVTMTVFQRGTQEPIKDAGVWALTRENAEAMQADVASVMEADEVAEPDYESLANIYGTFLGTTNGSGQLKHTFDEAGFYVLVAVKRGYIPGRTGIAIRTIRQALAIDAPRAALVGEDVTMTVFQRGTLEPVKDAGVWAITREDADAMREEMDSLRDENGALTAEMDYESMMNIYGIFLGTTNGSGQLKHAFDEAGWYLLVAVKGGYIPGFAPIGIRAPSTMDTSNILTAPDSTISIR